MLIRLGREGVAASNEATRLSRSASFQSASKVDDGPDYPSVVCPVDAHGRSFGHANAGPESIPSRTDHLATSIYPLAH
jgi:hypothetical protein